MKLMWYLSSGEEDRGLGLPGRGRHFTGGWEEQMFAMPGRQVLLT